MRKKITAAVIILTLVLTLLSCRQAPPEPATQQSDSDSMHIREEFAAMESQLSAAETVSSVNSPEAFNEELGKAEQRNISYEGNENIAINTGSNSDKIVSVKTSGSVSLDSPVNTLIINGADKGFTANAKADTVIFAGSSVTADIKSETGTVLVKGKDVTLNINNSNIEKLVVLNVYTTVNNLTEEEIAVTLANGTKVIVPAGNTYNVKDNTLQK